ncbi:GHKL domain-containing protein [Bacillus sp. ISL-35]|uniref:two-component system sensor histidine kinase NtrB n=1 Tax=Bacillus sp. ISL-35 TaxID=2819122 RepID=UPI001BE58C1E|nr:ATP-binding protein [Bacillus sp. ISL-35]MBT2680850.1 GHKL domain-containing protein [Bacillus sp. ISL-35]MBT2705166.1 GHKL domain-containing protein [Chryseobacterium sp. ISL-80]
MKMNNPSSAYSFQSKIEQKSSYKTDFTSQTGSHIFSFGTVLSSENRSIALRKLMVKDELAIMIDKKKAELESELQNLNQEILEKQQTLKALKEAMNDVSKDYQSISSSVLAAGLAHEIRNPLTTIKGFIQLLKPDLHSAGKQELADVALEEINRANSLLTEFLSVLKPAPAVKKKLPINCLIKNMKDLYTSEAILKGVDISVELAEEELYVMAEENSIKQVLINLLKNAMEAVEGSGRNDGAVKMIAGKDADFATISVIDNGSGIDEWSLKKIFTPFYTTKTEGTGIGLAISKQLIENHGGEMSVFSEPTRTIFKIALPALK